MARTKRVTFDNLPEMVGRLLEILTAEGTEHTALPELVQSVRSLENRMTNIERLLSTDRATIDRQTVLRVLKLRPKQLVELENTGVLLSHREGHKMVYYEDDVVRSFMNRQTWRTELEEASKPEPVEPVSGKPEVVESEPATAEAGRFIDIDAAAAMTGRTKSAIYNLTGKNKIPFTRERGKLSFEVAVLEEWMKAHHTRGRKPQNDESAKEDSTSKPEMVDINGASEILGRTPGAIRQQLTTLPHAKVGNKLYFNPKELEKWAIEHPSRKRKKSDETKTA